MKLKPFSLTALFIGVLFSVVGVITPLFRIGAIDIIGGADTPTYFGLMNGLPFCFILLGVYLIISGLFCLMFPKTVTTHCSLKNSLISLSVSAVGALGLSCAFMWYTFAAFGERSQHPIAYPFSVSVGALSFLIFIVLICVYFIIRIKNWSFKGFLIDFFTSIIFLPMFVFIISYLLEFFRH